MSVFKSDVARKLARRRLTPTNLLLIKTEVDKLKGMEGIPSKKMECLHGWGQLAERLQLPSELRQDLLTLKAAVKWIICASAQYLAREELMRQVGVANSQQLIGTGVRYHAANAEIIGLHYNGKIIVRFYTEVNGQLIHKWVEPGLVSPLTATAGV